MGSKLHSVTEATAGLVENVSVAGFATGVLLLPIKKVDHKDSLNRGIT